MCNAGVSAQVPPLAMDGKEPFRFRHAKNVSEIDCRRVSGRVNDGVFWMKNLHALPAQGIHNPEDILLIARDQPRRQHYQVTGMNLNRMLVAGNARYRRERLALRPSANQRYVFA